MTILEALEKGDKASLEQAVVTIRQELARLDKVMVASGYQDQKAGTRYWTLKWALGETK